LTYAASAYEWGTAARSEAASNRRSVKFTSSVLGGLPIGAGFGAATSLSTGFASPFEPDSFAHVASLVLDAGWAWAGLAMVAGWLAA
jgi:hypothetical protein